MTEHLGFLRSSDEYKIMAMASYGRPRFLPEPRDAVHAAEAAVRRVADRAGGLDAVVAAAGTDRCGRLVDIPGPEWDRVVLVNLLGTAAVVRAALPYLLRSHGKVVTVGSTLGVRALSDATAYCASKFGIVGFTGR